VICPLIGLTRHDGGSNLGAGSRWPWVLPPSLPAAAHLGDSYRATNVSRP